MRLILVAALLLAVPFLFHAGSTVHAADNEITGVTLTSPNPGELAITWDAPSNGLPDDYRVTWKKSDGNWPSYKNENTAQGGNAFPTERSHTVSGLEEGTEYSVRVRARYQNSEGNVEESGPWSTVQDITVAQTQLPAKPTGLLPGRSHDRVLLFWDDPDDDTITGYQILRGLDADSLTVLTNDTGDANTSYTDDTVAAETTYVYAIRARNANGLSPQSDTAAATTLAPPPEEPEIALAIAGVDFIIAGQMMDTTGTCNVTDITMIADGCTHDITNPMPQFGVVGTLDTDDRVSVKVGRDFAGLTDVADQSDLQGENQRILLDLQPGRNLLRVWGDENEAPGGTEQHFFRINVVPYWELDGERLSKDSACRSATTRTAAEITDSKCILTNFKPGFFRFHNVISDQFNAYVDVNTVEIVNEPGNTALAEPFTLDLQDGENVVRVRLAAKGSQPLAEVYDSDAFYYKVTARDVLISNLGQTTVDNDAIGHNTGVGIRAANGSQFTTGNNATGYQITAVRLEIGIIGDAVPMVSIYSDSANSPGSSLKVLTNPSNLPTVTQTAFDNEGLIDIAQRDFTTSDLKLDAKKKYWLVIERASGDGSILHRYVNTTATDPGGAPGWEINGGKFLLDGDTWTDTTFGVNPSKFAVKGALSTGVGRRNAERLWR